MPDARDRTMIEEKITSKEDINKAEIQMVDSSSNLGGEGQAWDEATSTTLTSTAEADSMEVEGGSMEVEEALEETNHHR